jgi:hypothetical protein
MAHEAGKGSRSRPYSVNQQTYGNNWDTIFKKKETQYIEVLEGEESWSQRVIDENNRNNENG